MFSAVEEKFEKTVANLFRARFPYLYIASWEENRVMSIIARVARNQSLIRTERTVFEWSINTGFVESGGHPVGQDTKGALKALEFIDNYQEPAVFVLKDFHVFFGADNRSVDIQVVRKVRDLLVRLKQSRNPQNVVFIAPTLTIASDLEKDLTIVEFPLPSFEEIRAVLKQMIEANRHSGRIEINLNEEEEERLAKAAMGLTLHEAENAFARSMVEDGKLDISDVEVVLEEKRQTIRKSGILEYINSDLNIDDVGGLQNLKRWLIKRNKSWLDSACRYNLPAPKGVLITGVPGCGKSLIAKAISAMWQLPLLRLDIGNIFSGLMGSSEENMRQAIQTAEAIAPCVLWIDEIEKGFSSTTSNSTGDSGTSARVFATFLTWMQEKTKPVFVVATANNISALPPEMMRKGRFDEIFFVDLPTQTERIEILKLHLRKRLTNPEVIGDFQIDQNTLNSLANKTEGFVGAELEQLVISGLFDAYYEDRSIKIDDFLRAVVQTVPLSVTQSEQIQNLREWANIRAIAATQKEDRTEYHYNNSDESNGTPGFKAPEGVLGNRGGRPVDF